MLPLAPAGGLVDSGVGVDSGVVVELGVVVEFGVAPEVPEPFAPGFIESCDDGELIWEDDWLESGVVAELGEL